MKIETVPFLFFCLQINGKEQSTRGVGSVAPHMFAGENDVEQQRVNGRFVPVTRSYNLYSDIQRADDIIVVLPAKAGEKRFKYEQKVKLVNPKITAEGKTVRGRGYTNYILTADDMLPVEENK